MKPSLPAIFLMGALSAMTLQDASAQIKPKISTELRSVQATEHSRPIIKALTPKGCLRSGDVVRILGKHFGDRSASALSYGIALRHQRNTVRVENVMSWAPEAISFVLPSQLTANTYVVGLMRGGQWQSNTDTSLTVCDSQLALDTSKPEYKDDSDQAQAEAPRDRNDSASNEDNLHSSIPRDSLSPQAYSAPPFPEIPSSNKNKRALLNDVVAKELLVISWTNDEADQLALQLKPLGLRIKRREKLDALGIIINTVSVPSSQPLPDTLLQLKNAMPDLWVDYNHWFRLLNSSNPKTWFFDAMAWTKAHRYCVGLNASAEKQKNNQSQFFKVGLIDTGIAEIDSLPQAQIKRKSFLVAGQKMPPPDHGTAIASLLLGEGLVSSNGLLPRIEIYSAKVFKYDKNKGAQTTAELIIRALNWMAAEKIRVVNLSLGGKKNILIELAINKLSSEGVSVVAAVGKDKKNQAFYPAQNPQVIAVDAIDVAGKPLNKASKKAPLKKDVLAPGVDLWLMDASGRYRYQTGSSFAAPIISGLLALAIAQGADDKKTVEHLKQETRFGKLWQTQTRCRYAGK